MYIFEGYQNHPRVHTVWYSLDKIKILDLVKLISHENRIFYSHEMYLISEKLLHCTVSIKIYLPYGINNMTVLKVLTWEKPIHKQRNKIRDHWAWYLL